MTALDVAEAVAAEMSDRGALGVALMGSYARGEESAYSDLDVVAIGTGDASMRVIDGVLVSQSWISLEAVRTGWQSPGDVGQVVPGWRSARPLLDNEDLVAQVKREAARWRWADLGDASDRWVAEQLVGYSEEVLRLVGHLQRGNQLPAAVMRNVLSNRMAWVASVHLHLLYETENKLWDLVADELGDDWLCDQRTALGIDAGLEASCVAALNLYERVVVLAGDTLGSSQRDVVTAAVAVSRLCEDRVRSGGGHSATHERREPGAT